MARETLTPREKNRWVKKTLKWVGFFSVVGLLDSIWLLILHAGKGSISGGCNLGPRVSCDPIYIQQYSEWFNIPIPVFSILYFGLAIAIVIQAFQRSDERYLIRPYAYLWLLSWVGLGTALCMAYIALIFLRTFCPYCSVLWVVLFVLWALCGRMMRVLDQPWFYLLSEDLRTGYKTPWFWGVGSVAALVLVGSFFFLHPTVTKLIGEPVEIVGEEARSVGPAHAKVTVVIFSDFQCPWCRVASEVLRQLSQEKKEEIRVVFKFFPLDQRCNESVARPMHIYSCMAAIASYCASVQGKFWAYHDYLFTSQDELPDSRLLSFARVAQLDLLKFDTCRRDPRSEMEVRKNVREGIALGIQGTPSIFINGQRYSGPITLSALRETVSAFR